MSDKNIPGVPDRTNLEARLPGRVGPRSKPRESHERRRLQKIGKLDTVKLVKGSLMT